MFLEVLFLMRMALLLGLAERQQIIFLAFRAFSVREYPIKEYFQAKHFQPTDSRWPIYSHLLAVVPHLFQREELGFLPPFLGKTGEISLQHLGSIR
ncbi:MAG: hypothetical protein EBR82_21950 [Caulobacteraceae bacterium]|nr:hypothetical protein [Caulobacteraceae bacterium]